MANAVKTCSKCNEEKPLDDFSRHSSTRDKKRAYCKSCAVSMVQDYKKKNPRWELGYRLRRKYGITLDEYDAMFDLQDGCCAICQEEFSVDVRGKYVCVDHDHKTGVVRGLLCFNCNTVLGKVQDDVGVLTRAILYLEREGESE